MPIAFRSGFWLAVMLLVAASPAVALAQVDQQALARAIVGDDRRAAQDAFDEATRALAPEEMGPELRAALIAALERQNQVYRATAEASTAREVSGFSPPELDRLGREFWGEGYGFLVETVIGLQDREAIPALAGVPLRAHCHRDSVPVAGTMTCLWWHAAAIGEGTPFPIALTGNTPRSGVEALLGSFAWTTSSPAFLLLVRWKQERRKRRLEGVAFQRQLRLPCGWGFHHSQGSLAPRGIRKPAQDLQPGSLGSPLDIRRSHTPRRPLHSSEERACAKATCATLLTCSLDNFGPVAS